MKILEVLKSKYCWIVITLSLILSYFLVLKDINTYTKTSIIILGIVYSILFSISNACLTKDIVKRTKEKIETRKESYISIFASILGYGALQTCTLGYTCTTPLIFALLPTSLIPVLVNNSIWLLLISDILLIYSVFKMKCFKN